MVVRLAPKASEQELLKTPLSVFIQCVGPSQEKAKDAILKESQLNATDINWTGAELACNARLLKRYSRHLLILRGFQSAILPCKISRVGSYLRGVAIL
ncbi:hypothetical protein E2320_009112 [Naja naja]|nr:hypothetical protein E2320_009112 [Naja naja]